MKTPIKTLLLLLALVIPRPAVRAADQEIKIYPGFNYIGAHVVSAPTTTPVLLSGFNQFVLQFKSDRKSVV